MNIQDVQNKRQPMEKAAITVTHRLSACLSNVYVGEECLHFKKEYRA